ncbi:MAG: hypothetical protein AAF363_01725 [Bacteroidota bacterium]
MKISALSNKPLYPSSISVLLIGKNAPALDAIKDKLRKHTGVSIVADMATNIKDGMLKAFSLKPNCIILDDDLDNEEINRFTQEMDKDESVSETPISILKTSNYRQIVNSRIQDFMLKEGITSDQLVRGVVNMMKYKKTNLYLYKTYKKGKTRISKLFK